MRYLEHDEADDPIVSVVNIIDIHLSGGDRRTGDRPHQKPAQPL